MWIDIGVNIGAKQFADDQAAVVQRAVAAGVDTMLFTGTSLSESAALLSLAERYQQYTTVGVHPHHASDWQADSSAALRALAGYPRVCAIGECGLDFNRNFSPPAAQEQAFVAQLALAAELSLPVFLHCRDAHDRFLHLLLPWLPRLPGAVLHCFTGSRRELAECLQQGLFIGITGWICDERRGQELLAMLPEIPLDRLLLETDAPWLLPRDLKPAPKDRRNEPAYLPHIAATVARQLGIQLAQLATQTSANARRLFALPGTG
ncbi:3'-5' ssDNA/RNA exonuclease TatD [Permianibacter sp. IMCC34836]|uniref:3'-5' ssDNA/RNA exonuclease TatD n=1 Tax=Permianibacter fluminis TaxID=2738515 RepID=UPI00155206D5|nr:3'-5' ssDNA/RNA exonuclease TatD [Permianibacter fluminis]NQD36140.1 3'-5' ssDNA/RNA exonuclease TatD [Permianibacter fluminis]